MVGNLFMIFFCGSQMKISYRETINTVLQWQNNHTYTHTLTQIEKQTCLPLVAKEVELSLSWLNYKNMRVQNQN